MKNVSVPEDLWNLEPQLTSSHIVDVFKKFWKEPERHRRQPSTSRLRRSFRHFRFHFRFETVQGISGFER
jgi:hypothetical protein